MAAGFCNRRPDSSHAHARRSPDGGFGRERRRARHFGPGGTRQPQRRGRVDRLRGVSGTVRRSGVPRGVRQAARSSSQDVRHGARRSDRQADCEHRPAGWKRPGGPGRGRGELAHGPDPRAPARLLPNGGPITGSRRGRGAFGPGAQRGDQWLPGIAQQRGPGADRISQAGAPLPVAGAGTGQAGRRWEGNPNRELRSAQRGRPAAHPGLPHAWRLRRGSGARNRQRPARLPDDRLGLPVERPGAGATHQPPLLL